MPKPNIGIMLDTESLGLAPKSVVLQWAFIAFDMDDPDTIYRTVEEYLPIQPQLTLGRTIEADALIWWMKQSDEARAGFERYAGNDFQELIALTNSITRKLNEVIESAETYEIIMRGSHHDLPMVQSLLADVGLDIPWHYDRILDLKSLMKEALVGKYEVPMAPGLVPHHALSDCTHQIACLLETRRRMRSRH